MQPGVAPLTPMLRQGREGLETWRSPGWDHRSKARCLEIVAVWIAAGNRQHARSEHILDCVRDMRRVARIVDQSGKRSVYRPAALGKRKQDHATVRGKPCIAAAEQERADVKQARTFWISRRLPFMRMSPHRLVFVDERAGRLPARAARANEIDNALAQVQRVALPHDPPPNMVNHSSPAASQLRGAAFGNPGCGWPTVGRVPAPPQPAAAGLTYARAPRTAAAMAGTARASVTISMWFRPGMIVTGTSARTALTAGSNLSAKNSSSFSPATIARGEAAFLRSAA